MAGFLSDVHAAHKAMEGAESALRALMAMHESDNADPMRDVTSPWFRGLVSKAHADLFAVLQGHPRGT